jgi:hypothetical protein
MKPDWKDAPKWASHLAMDENGGWFWYEFKPEIDESSGTWKVCEGSARVGRLEEWQETLESRPE